MFAAAQSSVYHGRRSLSTSPPQLCTSSTSGEILSRRRSIPSVLDSYVVQATTSYVTSPLISGTSKISKQRRRRLNRNKRTRSRRGFIRIGVEQLESRVQPGGFLDLFAGAAIASTFDLLPEQPLVPEGIESKSDTFTPRVSALLQTGSFLPNSDGEANEERVELTQTDDDLEFVSTSPAISNTLVATSFVDSFFASNRFIDTTPHLPVSPSPLSTPAHPFSSPTRQLGAGIGTGSGQGYNVSGAELPQENIGSSVSAASSMPAWMMGEGEASASGSSSGSNTPPEAYDSSDMILHDQTLYSMASGSDIDGDMLTFSATTSPLNGTLNFSSDGSFDYTPSAGFVGSDSFDFEVSDGIDTDTGTITIDVYNTAPEAYDSSDTVLHDQTLYSMASGSDIDGDMLTFSATTSPANGTLNLSSDGSFDYTPNAGYVGNDSFNFEVSDGLNTDSATIMIDVYNTAPEAYDSSETVLRDQTLYSMAAGSDIDGDMLTFSTTTSPANGTLNLSGDGSFDYTPNAGYLGSDSFGFSVSDGIASDTGVITIDVVCDLSETPMGGSGAIGEGAPIGTSVFTVSAPSTWGPYT